jgi:hypothetical protein
MSKMVDRGWEAVGILSAAVSETSASSFTQTSYYSTLVPQQLFGVRIVFVSRTAIAIKCVP